MTLSSGQLAPQDSISSVQPLTELSLDAESRRDLRSPLLSTRRTSAVWKYSRQPNSTEPKSTKHHQRIWYCKTQDCCYHTHNLGNAESHLRVKHHIILEATNSPRSQNIRSLIDQQQKRKADDSLADERFENQLRSIVDSAVVRKALAELVARRNLPYSCVEWPELRALISAFNYAAASVLPRSHVSVARLITIQYHARRRGLQKQLLCARSKIHLTTDSWTSPNKLEFQAVTCHFVGSEGVLRKALLCLPELLKGHAGSEVAPIILDSIQNIGIVDRIGYITSDNASSNDKAMSALSDHIPDWDPIQHRTRCLGHCINLAAQAFMSAPSKAAIDYSQSQAPAVNEPNEPYGFEQQGYVRQPCLQILHDFMHWIRNGLARYKAFKHHVYNERRLAPILCNTTRWNSWYYMIRRALRTRVVVDSIMAQKDCPFSLDQEHWTLITHAYNFLQPFHEATIRLEGDRVTLDEVLWCMDVLREHLEESEGAARYDNALHTSVVACWYAFDKWYEAIDHTPVYAAAVLLHPYRRLAHLKHYWPKRWVAPALANVRALWLKEYRGRKSGPASPSPCSVGSSRAQSRFGFRPVVTQAQDDEFERFIRQDTLEIVSPLEWWNESAQQRSYPNLQQMALDILSIPSMSAESERVFSGTRRQITFDRSRLNGSSIGRAECLKSWIKNDIEPIEEGSRAGTPADDDESEDIDVELVLEDSS